MAADKWLLPRTEYLSSNLSIRQVAAKHGVSEAALEKRASREKWRVQRQELAEKAVASADSDMTEARVAELLKFNADDLRVARAIKNRAAVLLQANPGADELRTLASSFEVARRMGLAALGVDREGQLPQGDPEKLLPVSVTIERKSARKAPSADAE